jgi:MerR family mercuric resistance operon transcriptional regulator
VRSGELAAAAGVNRQTLRYYERRRLLPEPARSLGGHREYPADALHRLRAIKAAQRLGFSLGEIAELLPGRGPGPTERARAKLADVDARLAELLALRATLVEVADAGCSDLVSCAAEPACPIPFAAAGPPPGVQEGHLPVP